MKGIAALIKSKVFNKFKKSPYQVDTSAKQVSKLAKEVNIPWPRVFLGLALISTITGGLFATKTLAGIDKNIAAAKEAQRPANIKMIKITAPNCLDCFNLETAVATFKKQNVSVGEERTIQSDSSEAQSLIKDLEISRVPTYIVTGEVSKNNLEGFIKNNGKVKNSSFVFSKVTPVFIDPGTKKEMGRVTATILTDPSCTQCLDPKLNVEQFKKSNVKIVDQKEVIWNSAEGQKLINQYKITKLPTFLFSPDIEVYEDVKAGWKNLGTVEQDKTYVARNLFLPYRDLEEGQILGLVDFVYLTDSSCSDCYKPQEIHKNILTRGYGVGLASERTVDSNSSEGQGLISKYKLTKIPTILLSPEVDKYDSLKETWKNVGIIGSDGWYVFTNMEEMGNVVYKDLTTNQIVGRAKVSPTTSPSTSPVSQ